MIVIVQSNCQYSRHTDAVIQMVVCKELSHIPFIQVVICTAAISKTSFSKWELSRLCHVTKNNHLIIFTTIYYGLLGGHLRMGALLVCFMNCPPNSN